VFATVAGTGAQLDASGFSLQAGSLKALVCSLFAATLLAPPSACISQELGRRDVIMKPFETMGQADAELAKLLRHNLAQAIERNSDYRVASGGSAFYYLKGQVLSDGKRHVLTLQLFKAKTDRMLWLENYDYRTITTAMMATDVIAALSSVPDSDTWN
jgi:hypothetical protein